VRALLSTWEQFRGRQGAVVVIIEWAEHLRVGGDFRFGGRTVLIGFE